MYCEKWQRGLLVTGSEKILKPEVKKYIFEKLITNCLESYILVFLLNPTLMYGLLAFASIGKYPHPSCTLLGPV